MVTVTAPLLPKIVSFRASPERMTRPGLTQLRWETQNAMLVAVWNASTNKKLTESRNSMGKWGVDTAKNTTYRLEAFNATGQKAEATVKVWVIEPEPDKKQLRGVYTIQQKSNGRYIDAHGDSGHDYDLVTRPVQNNDTQRWIVKPLGNNTYTIQQKSNGRYVDAHGDSGHDYALVTRPALNNDTQRWILKPLGNSIYTIQQKSNGRYVDAHEDSGHDYALATRTAQNNDTQRWLIRAVGPAPQAQQLKLLQLQSNASERCTRAVQGKIAWNYEGNTSWADANLQRLCRGATSAEPAKCFERVMHGGINWGGSTRWQWRNAIDLCEGSTDAGRTVRCFQEKIAKGHDWQQATAACDERSAH